VYLHVGQRGQLDGVGDLRWCGGIGWTYTRPDIIDAMNRSSTIVSRALGLMGVHASLDGGLSEICSYLMRAKLGDASMGFNCRGHDFHNP
jgi:hypothetical protein